uniref:WDR59/RTC1-like RING zinc finger domain-containing protein n=3 Tax=Amphimedon queenslandica TaxID=400682 RepID=A0A1X7UKS0_AMPQE
SHSNEGESGLDDESQDITGVLEFFEYNENDSDSSTSESASHTHQELELPKEPFQLRQEIASHSLEVPEFDIGSSHSGGISHASSGRRSSQHTLNFPNQFIPGWTPPTWDFSPQVAEVLKHYAGKGDVQMSVTIILVFGERVSKLIPEVTLLQWFHSYIDLLTQYQLLNEAVYITKNCPLKQIKEISQSSTLYNIGCGRCNKPIPPANIMCQKCEGRLNICSVCHAPVKGLYSMCEVCGHGGHMSHLKEWFSTNSWCPSGCGHNCVT